MKFKIIRALVISAVVTFVSNSSASELVYTPLNPSFGGNLGFGSHLLGIANAQKQFKEERDEQTPLEEFNERLQRSLLSRITSAVTRDIVDINGNITPGNFSTIDYEIQIIDEGDGLITIITTDKVSGEQSIIQVNNEF